MRSVTRGDNIRHGHAQPGRRAHQHLTSSILCPHQRLVHTHAAHVLHGGLAQPTQSVKRLAVYTDVHCAPDADDRPDAAHRHLCGSRSVRQDEVPAPLLRTPYVSMGDIRESSRLGSRRLYLKLLANRNVASRYSVGWANEPGRGRRIIAQRVAPVGGGAPCVWRACVGEPTAGRGRDSHGA
eukprot:2464147-Prymnesium_polylepis.2